VLDKTYRIVATPHTHTHRQHRAVPGAVYKSRRAVDLPGALGLSCFAAGKAAAQSPFQPPRSVWPIKTSTTPEAGGLENIKYTMTRAIEDSREDTRALLFVPH